MYTKPKLLSSICIMLVSLNALALLLCILYVSSLPISFAVYIMIVAYLVTATLISILLTAGLRDLALQLNLEYESNTRKLTELSKKVTSLEKQLDSQ